MEWQFYIFLDKAEGLDNRSSKGRGHKENKERMALIEESHHDEQEIENALQAVSVRECRCNAIVTLAGASRQSSMVRRRLADPQIIASLVDAVVHSCDEDLQTTHLALRCIANASVDNDTARDTIVTLGVSWIMQCMRCDDDATRLLTTKVLYNICSDHENSQQACYREKVHYELLRFLTSDYAVQLPTACKLAGDLDPPIDVLFWISGQKASLEATSGGTEALPGDIFQSLLTLRDVWVQDWGIGTFATLVETMLVFIRDATVQTQIVNANHVTRVWATLSTQDYMLRVLRIKQGGGGDGLGLPPYGDEDPEEDAKLLGPLSASLVWCLSDMAAHADFVKKHSLDDVLLRLCRETVQDAADGVLHGDAMSTPQNQLVTVTPEGHQFVAACQILGNWLWALQKTDASPSEGQQFIQRAHQVAIDAVAQLLEQEEDERASTHDSLRRRALHHSLFYIIVQNRHSNTVDALHAMQGLLIQLSRPSVQAREKVGSDELAREALEIMASHDRQEIKQGCIKLLKALGKDSPANQGRFTELARCTMAALRGGSSADHAGMAVETPLA